MKYNFAWIQLYKYVNNVIMENTKLSFLNPILALEHLISKDKKKLFNHKTFK